MLDIATYVQWEANDDCTDMLTVFKAPAASTQNGSQRVSLSA